MDLPREQPGLRPPQFGLRMLFWLTASVAAFFAVFLWVGFFWAAVLLFFLLLTGAHVAGNSLGTQLRESSRHSEPPPGQPLPLPDAARSQAATQMQEKRPLGRVMLAIPLACGLAAATAVISIYWERAALPAVLMGAFSAAAIAAIIGFAISCFFRIAHMSWRDAVREEKRK